MFTKEAEERYYKNYPVTLNIGEEERYKKFTDIWKNGAEFGYNKCFEQIKKVVNEGTRLDCIIPELLRLQEKETAE